MSTTKLQRGLATWRTVWPQLSMARRVVYAVFNVLSIAAVAGVGVGGFAFLYAVERALLHLDGVSVLAAVGAAVVGTGWLLRLAIVDPMLPDDLSDRPLAPTVVHAVAGLLALAIAAWVGAAGWLGVELAIRPEVYAQVAQIIPVLLLAVLLERRLFPVEPVRQADERTILRFAFHVLVVAPCLAEVFGLLALATRTEWIAIAATVLSAAAVPSLLVLIAGPVLLALYDPTRADTAS